MSLNQFVFLKLAVDDGPSGSEANTEVLSSLKREREHYTCMHK